LGENFASLYICERAEICSLKYSLWLPQRTLWTGLCSFC